MEKWSFTHTLSNSSLTHLYLSGDLTKLIELMIPKANKKSKATYNLYNIKKEGSDYFHSFDKSLNDNDNEKDGEYVEWHHKTLFPYSLDLHTFKPVSSPN